MMDSQALKHIYFVDSLSFLLSLIYGGFGGEITYEHKILLGNADKCSKNTF